MPPASLIGRKFAEMVLVSATWLIKTWSGDQENGAELTIPHAGYGVCSGGRRIPEQKEQIAKEQKCTGTPPTQVQGDVADKAPSRSVPEFPKRLMANGYIEWKVSSQYVIPLSGSRKSVFLEQIITWSMAGRRKCTSRVQGVIRYTNFICLSRKKQLLPQPLFSPLALVFMIPY